MSRPLSDFAATGVKTFSYPLAIVSAVAAGFWLLAAGVAPNTAVALVSVAYALLAWALETRFPETPRWKLQAVEARTDLLHALLSNPIPTAIVRAALYSSLVAASDAITRTVGFGLWPTEWPLLAQFVLAVAVADSVSYAIHRALHESRLWPLHAVHHCSPRMYFLLSMRKHPLQAFVTYGGRLSVLWLLGIPADALALYTILTAANSYIQHANLHVRTGPLGWMFATPELHRIHHSDRVEELNTNYGDVLIVWDRLFGTFLQPAESRPLGDDVGLPGISVPQTYTSHLALPFRWSRLAAEAARDRDPFREHAPRSHGDHR